MRNATIVEKFYADFRQLELETLGRKPQDVVTNITKGDKIILEDKLLDYLRDFFNNIYDGEPIPKTFEKVLIEWRTGNGLMNLYVTFPEEHSDWIYIDVFFGWRFLGKLLFPNVKLDDEDRCETGQFYTYTPFLTKESFDQNFLQQLIPCVKDVFTYVFLYVEANKNVKAMYVEEKVSSPKRQSKPAKKKNGNAAKPGEREKIYVPTRRLYKITNFVSEECENNLRDYIYARWKVRGYTYTRKDGRKVNVKEHFAFRHLPNKGVIKEEGRDYILRKAEDENQ